MGDDTKHSPGKGFEMNKTIRTLAIVAAGAAIVAGATGAAMQHYYCKYCGYKTTSIQTLTASMCQRHPAGPGKGRHALYEGGEKDVYFCKFCGYKSSSIQTLTASKCQRHPDGPLKGRHAPAL